MSEWCTQYPLMQTIYREYALTIVFAAGLVAMLYAVNKFIRSYVRDRNASKSHRGLFYLSLTYYLVLIVYFIDRIIYNQVLCRNETVLFYTDMIAVYIYVFQTLLLAFIFLLRLVTIFDGTAYAVSKITMITYATLIIFDACLVLIFWVVTLWALVVAAVISLGVTIGLNVTFIHKLSVVYKGCNKDVRSLLTVITRTALLCFVSTLMTFLFIAVFVFIGVVRSVHYDFVCELMLFLDVSTGFLCVLLATKHFDKWYFWLCKCGHRRLTLCCNVCMKGQAMEWKNGEIAIQSVSPDIEATRTEEVAAL